MNAIDLKPCPFCGGEVIFSQTSYGASEGSVNLAFSIRCKKCDATAPNSYGKVYINLAKDGTLNVWGDDRPKAAESWNRRAGEDG